MRCASLAILIAAVSTAAAEPTTRSAETIGVAGAATVRLAGRSDQRLAEAQKLAYENCLFQAAAQLDPTLAQLDDAARGALVERLQSQWHRIFIEAEVIDLTTGGGKLRLRVRCRFHRGRLAEALVSKHASRMVLITGPPAAAGHLERQLAVRLTAGGHETLPVVALAPEVAAQWRKSAGGKELRIYLRYADKSKVLRVIHGRLELSTTGQLLAGKVLFACTASVSWRLIDATTARIEQASRLSASAEGLRRADAERSAVDRLAAALAPKLTGRFKKFGEPDENRKTIYLRVAGLRVDEVRLLDDEIRRQSAVAQTWLMYYQRPTGLFALQLADDAGVEALTEALASLRGIGLEVQERKGNEWACTIAKHAAPPQ